MCGSDMEIQKYESVAQLVELPAFNRKAVGSSPATFTIYGGVAQLVELPALNRKAAGSSPVTPTTYGNIAQSAERSAVNRQVVGSIPAIPARKLQRRRWLHQMTFNHSNWCRFESCRFSSENRGAIGRRR